jgi:hypothetical protein
MRELVSYEVVREDIGNGDHRMVCRADWSDGRSTYHGGASTGVAIHDLYHRLYTQAVVRTIADKHARAWEQMRGKRLGVEYADEAA